MDWLNLAGWFVSWLIFFPSFILGQISLTSYYSWKDKNDPKEYFKLNSRTLLKMFWARKRMIFAVYCVFLCAAIAIIIAASCMSLGASAYIGWPLGFVGFIVVEIVVFRLRHFLYNLYLGRFKSNYWGRMKASGMLELLPVMLFLTPILYVLLATQQILSR